jgi:hypothetical protein
MDELSDIVTADATALAAAIRGKQLSSGHRAPSDSVWPLSIFGAGGTSSGRFAVPDAPSCIT